VKFLLDTDHLSILQEQSGAEYDRIAAHIRQHAQDEIALSIVSFHEQV
jgi:tRNA(fMet)-specific endonuclease VapC